MWRSLSIGLIALALLMGLASTLEVYYKVRQLLGINAASGADLRQQVAWKALEFSRSMTQVIWEGRGLCLLIAGLAGLSIWRALRRRALSRPDLLRATRAAASSGLIGLWFWWTGPFLTIVSNIEMLGMPSPGRELLLVPVLKRYLPIITNSWILLLLAVVLLLEWPVPARGARAPLNDVPV